MTLEEWNALKPGDLLTMVNDNWKNIYNKVEVVKETNETSYWLEVKFVDPTQYIDNKGKVTATYKAGFQWGTSEYAYFMHYPVEKKITTPIPKKSNTRFIAPAKDNHLCSFCQTIDPKIYVSLQTIECINPKCSKYVLTAIT